MKKLSALLLLLSAAVIFGQGIKFDQGNFSQLLAKAKQENKLIFVDAYASWCGPCKLMVKNIFPLEEVGNYYNNHFINASIDMEKGEGVELAKKYQVNAYPTYLYINGDGKLIHRALGYIQKEDFIKAGQDALDPSRNLNAMISEYDAGSREPALLKNLALATAYSNPKLSREATTEYFKQKTDHQFTKEDIELLMTGISGTDSANYKIFKDEKANLVKPGLLTETEYEGINTSINAREVFKQAYDEKTKTLNEKLFVEELAKRIGEKPAKNALNSYVASLALQQKDYVKYAKVLTEMYGKDYKDLSANSLNSYAWNFYENVKDKKALKVALQWALESVNKEEKYYNTDTLAHLYQKLGDKKNAKTWAEKSITLGKEEGEDVSETETFLKSL